MSYVKTNSRIHMELYVFTHSIIGKTSLFCQLFPPPIPSPQWPAIQSVRGVRGRDGPEAGAGTGDEAPEEGMYTDDYVVL